MVDDTLQILFAISLLLGILYIKVADQDENNKDYAFYYGGFFLVSLAILGEIFIVFKRR